LEDLSHVDICDFLDGYVGLFEGGLDGDGAELRGSERGKRAVELGNVSVSCHRLFPIYFLQGEDELTFAVGVRAALRMYASCTSLASFLEVLNCRRGRWPAWRARRAVALDACIVGILKMKTRAKGWNEPKMKEIEEQDSDVC
jgi:hypothetical protein